MTHNRSVGLTLWPQMPLLDLRNVSNWILYDRKQKVHQLGQACCSRAGHGQAHQGPNLCKTLTAGDCKACTAASLKERPQAPQKRTGHIMPLHPGV